MLNNKYANAHTAVQMDKSNGMGSSFDNPSNPPYNEMVAKMVECGKKFEIKFAEKKKKDNYMQTMVEKTEALKVDKPCMSEQPLLDMMKMFAMFTKF